MATLRKPLFFTEESNQKQINKNREIHLILCVDNYISTDEKVREEFQDALQNFFIRISENSLLSTQASIEVIQPGSTNHHSLNSYLHFDLHNRYLMWNHSLNMGEGIYNAYQQIHKNRPKFMKGYVPIIVLLATGTSTDDIAKHLKLAQVDFAKTYSSTHKFAIAIGSNPKLKGLKKFNPKRTPLKIKDHKIETFFDWLFQVLLDIICNTKKEISLHKDQLVKWADFLPAISADNPTL